ncbi:hypothetical protein ZIOFF_016357 [Zingiber officinale]|uniref:Uncharacterized protein n=1 Tax=Zingiber officinale TaxID=94328 RepID=A0A8J5HSM3_ZINOF|nr:hypothetical protein ZIOFF_016357 [Zingiber officinale]
MLEAKSLRKAAVPPSLLGNPSPGNIQATRLALHVNDGGSSCSVYIASGCSVYKIEVGAVLLSVSFVALLCCFFEEFCYLVEWILQVVSWAISPVSYSISMEDSIITTGKESLLIPVNAEVKHSSIVDRCPHRSEVQSVALTQGDDNCLIMGSVDCYGHLIVSWLDALGSDIDRVSYSVLPRDCGIGEGSWAGVCFSPVAVARSFCKSIDIYDQDIHIRSLHTLWYPASLTFFSNPYYEGCPSVLAVTEGSQLSVWDLRTNQNGGCVQRVCGSVGDLMYALCSSPSGAIAAGGTDRAVTIYDPRRWSAVSRWVNCSKYEITGLAFSTINSDYIYVQGVGYEVTCGAWKESKRTFSFRGDSNWLGFSKLSPAVQQSHHNIAGAGYGMTFLGWIVGFHAIWLEGFQISVGFLECSNADVLAGWCDSGSIFVADAVEQH